ncbi:MAG: hypothetical protein WEC12_06210 [Balneolaceae bacterium]
MKKSRSWITSVLTDLIVTAAIIAAVLLEYRWLFYLVVGYTLFMLVVKWMVLFSKQLQAIAGKEKTVVPEWVYHILYGLNVAFLLLSGWIFTAVAWLLIWALSTYNVRKTNVTVLPPVD